MRLNSEWDKNWSGGESVQFRLYSAEGSKRLIFNSSENHPLVLNPWKKIKWFNKMAVNSTKVSTLKSTTCKCIEQCCICTFKESSEFPQTRITWKKKCDEHHSALSSPITK